MQTTGDDDRMRIFLPCFFTAALFIACIGNAHSYPSEAFTSRRDALLRKLDELKPLKLKDSADYVPAAREQLGKLEALVQEFVQEPHARYGLTGDILTRKLELAAFVRFRLHQPRRALDLYREAERFGDKMPSAEGDTGWVGTLGIADTYQFDLGDKARALSEYRRLLGSLRAVKEKDTKTAAMADWADRWLSHQITFLQEGRRFAGPVTWEDTAAVGLLNVFGGKSGLLGLEAGSKVTDPESAPASTFTLIQVALDLSKWEDGEAVLRFLRRVDPAGYVSAILLGIADRMRVATPGFREAARRYLAEGKIAIVGIAPDPRMISPQATWDIFIDSLRKGDAETALSCLGGELRTRLRPMLSKMTPAQMKEMGDSFKSFAMLSTSSDSGEAAVVRNNGKAGIVSFEKYGNSWKIDEM